MSYEFLTVVGQARPSDSPGMATGLVLFGIIQGVLIVCLLGYIFRKRFPRSRAQNPNSDLNLQAEKAKSSIIINSMEDGVLVLDSTGVIRLSNPSAAKIVEWELADISNIDYASVLHFVDNNGNPLDKALDPVSQAFKTARNIRSNDIVIHTQKSNKQQFISISVSPILSKGTQVSGVVVIFRDISTEKSEEKRRADFISTASHEMRTPVAAIEGYLALALNAHVSTIDEKARSYIEKAHSSTQHLGKLFQDLLTSAKAEDGRLVSHPQVIEMGHYLEQLVDSLRFTAEKKGLLLDFTVGTTGADASSVMNGKVIKPLYYTHADMDRMREVITNLFDNAVKYTESGKISIGLTGNNEVVQLFIRDTGPGIPAADVGHLFQKFYRVDNSATRTIGGTGLGLFISRKIVELYNGRIWVESEVGKGSTFYINLPRLSAQKADELLKKESLNAQNASPLDNA